MIADYPVDESPALPIVGREILSLVASGLLYPFGFGSDQTRTQRRREQRTVVLVHGYLANRSCFLPLRAWLKTQGIKKVLTYEYSGARGIEQAALGLREYLKRHVRGGRVDLVCHSLGGLIETNIVYQDNLEETDPDASLLELRRRTGFDGLWHQTREFQLAEGEYGRDEDEKDDEDAEPQIQSFRLIEGE